MRNKICFYLDDIDTSIGITINLVILVLIVLSLGLFVAETYPLPTSLLLYLSYLDKSILIIFTLEYLIRVSFAKNPLKFIFSIYSFIDLIAILPLFLGLMDIRFIRIFRWFRLLRLFRFLPLEIAMFGIKTKDSIIVTRILLTLFSLIFVYSGLIYQVEHQVNPGNFRNFFDALYFSVVTMTTVGFGDVTPLSETGRVLTLLMIFTGIILIPGQLSDLIKQLVKSANHVEKNCSGCGLALHDPDALYCKICGTKLKLNRSNEITTAPDRPLTIGNGQKAD